MFSENKLTGRIKIFQIVESTDGEINIIKYDNLNDL